MAHPGLIYRGGVIESARFNTIHYATKDLAWNHATDSGSWGLRYPGELRIFPKTNVDALGRGIPDSYPVEIKFRTFQATIPVLHNTLLQSQEPFQAYVRTTNDKYYNFIHDAAAAGASSTGSRLVGLMHEFYIDENQRYLDITLSTSLSHLQLDWLHDNLASLATAGTGGDDWPLVANTYDRGDHTIGNIADIDIDSSSVGVINSPVVKWTQIGVVDQFGRPVGGQKLRHEVSFNALQNNAAQATAFQNDMRSDVPIIITTLYGDQLQYNSGVLSVSAIENVGEENNHFAVTLTGETPYNKAEATPNSIDLGVGDANIMEFTAIGLS